MPSQDLKQRQATTRMQRAPRQWTARLRRTWVFIATLAVTAIGSYEMYRVLNVTGMTMLQVALLVVFVMTFAWIALPFVSGLAGLVTLWRKRSASGLSIPPLQLPPRLTGRTVLLMPTYNEAPERIIAGLQAIYESLDGIDALEHFDFFILSDTTEPEVWLAEELGFWELRRRTGGEARIFYRHRPKNVGRKAGNIADFVAVYLGHALWRDLAGTALFIEGDRDLARQLPGWIRLDKVVGRDFPVVRPAA